MRVKGLQGVTCIVTGGGRGIGRYTAEALAVRGGVVAICARTSSELDDTTDAIEEITGRRPLASTVDVADRTAVRGFAARVVDELGPPGLLVNNAAMLGPVGPITDVDLDEWHRTLAVNVGGVAAMCASVAPAMSAGGAIVNLSGGGVGGPGLAPYVSAYTASKTAVVSLTEALARELAPAGITVNAIAPGPVATGFMGPVLAAGPEQSGALYETTLAQRGSTASLEPFVELICYLASTEGRWLSGRLLSARWDHIEDLAAKKGAFTASLFTLRRIDDALYGELPS